MGFGNRLRLWCFLLLASFLVCTARSPFVLSVGEEALAVEAGASGGRSLKAMNTDDYNDPSANRGHDPRNRIGGGWKVREP